MKNHLPGHSDGCWRLPSHFTCAHRRIEQLQAIVNKLPKCWRLDESGKPVRDVPVVPGMVLLFRNDAGRIVREVAIHFLTGTCDDILTWCGWVSLTRCAITSEALKAVEAAGEEVGS